MNTPDSMKAELAEWNSGEGVTLETWVGCMGRFSLAVGYASVFWPEFVEFEDLILSQGFSEDTIRNMMNRADYNPHSAEWMNNHLHILDIQYVGCEDVSRDKLVALGTTLKEMWEAKLKWQFPERPCKVEFYQPDDIDDLSQYQISFWQEKHVHT